jgi:hypothetical protein
LAAAAFELEPNAFDRVSAPIAGEENVYVIYLEKNHRAARAQLRRSQDRVLAVRQGKRRGRGAGRQGRRSRKPPPPGLAEGKSFADVAPAPVPRSNRRTVHRPLRLLLDQRGRPDARAGRGELQPGEVAEPVATGDGMIVAYLKARTPADPASFDSYQDEIANAIRNRRAQGLFREWQAACSPRARFTDLQRTAADQVEGADEELAEEPAEEPMPPPRKKRCRKDQPPGAPMIVTTKELFAHAYGKYAIGAYNINNLEQTMGLFKGNVDSKAPFIVQLSKGARSYTHKLMLEAMMKTANEIFPEAVFAIHLDHGDEATCMDCINSGYSSVMIDHSHASFEENVAVTKRVVEAAHAKGVVVEAEIGQLKGIEEDIVAAEHVYTKPDEADQFVKPPAATASPARSAPPTAPSSSRATRSCASTSSRRSRSCCPASRSSCTAPPRCRRTKWPASTPPAATSRAPRASMPPSSSARPSSA